MTTNNENLDLIYRRISILQMVESLKSCATVWNTLYPNVYQATHKVGEDFWDVAISRNPQTELVTVDFRKNGTYFYTINSDTDSNLIQFFRDIEGDEDFQKDRQILKDVGEISGCS